MVVAGMPAAATGDVRVRVRSKGGHDAADHPDRAVRVVAGAPSDHLVENARKPPHIRRAGAEVDH